MKRWPIQTRHFSRIDLIIEADGVAIARRYESASLCMRTVGGQFPIDLKAAAIAVEDD
jgi:hypothetical protein